MIHAGGIRLRQAAGGAALRVFIHPSGFGLNAGDQKHGVLDKLVKQAALVGCSTHKLYCIKKSAIVKVQTLFEESI